MTAIEILEWLYKGCYDERYSDILDGDKQAIGNIKYLFDSLSPQLVLDRIEKYEAEKNVPDINVGNIEQDFKVGDLVKNKRSGVVGKITRICDSGSIQVEEKTNVINTHDSCRTLEHAEPPKEESLKEEIEFSDFKNVIKEKIGEECANIVLSSPKEFGDWIARMKWHVKRCNELRRTLDIIDNTEPPKEEKQKIEKISFPNNVLYAERIENKINELVDAVNKLRGE